MDRLRYFAYGSNLSAARLRARTGRAHRVGVYLLRRHELRFHKAGTDGSAKCDAFFTGSRDHVIEGVVFEVEPEGVEALDRVEGLGRGYGKKSVTVVGDDGELEALTYFATHIDASMRPYSWYKHHVIVGAREAGLSAEYVAEIESIEAIEDPDPARARREQAIHD